MTNLARASLALSLAALLSASTAPSIHAILVEDLGVRKGAPAHISLSTGFNGFVGAGIRKIQVDGVQMDAFCIDPFTMALRSSPGYKFVPLTKAPEAPFTLSASEATEISDLWAMFYNPGMKENKAAGLQLAIWEIVGGDDFSVIGKDYGASLMLAALRSYSGPGAGLIALTGPGQDYVVLTPPGYQSTPTPTPHSTPTPTPHSTPTPTPLSTPTPNPRSIPTPTPTPIPTAPPHSTPNPTPPPHNVPDSGSTFALFATAILALLALNTSCVPALVRARVTRDRMSAKRP
jgi:cell division septation protein DedD